MGPHDSLEEVRQRLAELAEGLWGSDRAAEIESSIDQTARHLVEVARTVPDRHLEPGFYQ
jgi:TPP-dependent pyruvate/acetoin dehydrogenase alpha subunit